MITRRNLAPLLLAFAGCTRPSKSLREALPAQLAGGAWTLRDAEQLPAEEAPAVVRALGLERAIRASYQGNGTIRVRVFEMKVEASAFELIQKWRQQDGLAVYKGRHFIVANGEGAEQAAIASFLQAFQREWNL